MMFELFKKKKTKKENNLPIIAIAAILIHCAKIDENFTDKERKIVQETLIGIGLNSKDVDKITKEAELKEKDSNQILGFTREINNIREDEKKKIVESLWRIIYSDKNADIYETNLMRRLSGLLYLDNKVVGDIKEKVKLKINDLSG